MRAMLCGCGKRLEAVGIDGLVSETVEHHRWVHGMAIVDEEGVRRIVEESSYDSGGLAAAYATDRSENLRSHDLSGNLVP